MASKHVLVTGGCGFIGSHIVDRLLNEGHRVTVLDNLSTGCLRNLEPSRERLTLVVGDVSSERDVKACFLGETVDLVCHQAALGSVPRSMDSPLDTVRNNVTGFSVLYDAARRHGVKRFVYASSSSVYGSDTRDTKVEGFEGDPMSVYALSKSYDEQFARTCALIPGNAMRAIGLRYFNVFGPRQRPDGPYAAVIPRFVKHALAGTQATIYGDGSFSRDFTHVSNAVEANFCALFGHVLGEPADTFNVGLGNEVSVLKLHKTISEKAGTNVPPKFEPERPGDVPWSKACTLKVTEMLQFRPVTALDEGIDATVEWYKQHDLGYWDRPRRRAAPAFCAALLTSSFILGAVLYHRFA